MPKPSALDKFLEHHKRSCTYFVFSGDRHCSCGRDAAAKELAELREQIKALQFGDREWFEVIDEIPF